MTTQTYPVAAGKTITVAAAINTVSVRKQPDGDPVLVAAGDSVVYGPFVRGEFYEVFEANGAVATVTIAEGDYTLVTAAQAALLSVIPTEDPADGVTIWNDTGVLKVASPAP